MKRKVDDTWNPFSIDYVSVADRHYSDDDDDDGGEHWLFHDDDDNTTSSWMTFERAIDNLHRIRQWSTTRSRTAFPYEHKKETKITFVQDKADIRVTWDGNGHFKRPKRLAFTDVCDVKRALEFQSYYMGCHLEDNGDYHLSFKYSGQESAVYKSHLVHNNKVFKCFSFPTTPFRWYYIMYSKEDVPRPPKIIDSINQSAKYCSFLLQARWNLPFSLITNFCEQHLQKDLQNPIFSYLFNLHFQEASFYNSKEYRSFC